MLARRLCVISLLVAPGCSLMLDTGAFLTVDAGPADAEIRIDADPTALVLTGIQPAEILEGSGCIPAPPPEDENEEAVEACTGAGRAVPIVVTGANIDPEEATVILNGAGFEDEEVEVVVSPAGDLLAFPIRIPVNLEASAGTDDLLVTVRQPGGEATRVLSVRWLPELLTSNGSPAPDQLAPIYSRVVVDAPTVFGSSPSPVRLVATAEIVVLESIDVSAAGRLGGPGACDGGTEQNPGQCGDAGGRAGGTTGGASPSVGGGGGGGYATDGTAGGGPGGAAGTSSGTPTLNEIGGEANRGSGGGGGRGAGLTGAGGRGGGGGGTIELTSRGGLRVAAPVLADGVSGAGGSGGGCSVIAGVIANAGGGGGGGSGGTILVRAPVLELEESGSELLLARGGNGGQGAGEDCHGGPGAAGRIRVDTASEGLALVDLAEPVPFRGAMIHLDLPVISRASMISVLVVGDPGAIYGLRDEESYRARNGGQTALVELRPGPNRICTIVEDDATLDRDEAMNCLTIAYIPE